MNINLLFIELLYYICNCAEIRENKTISYNLYLEFCGHLIQFVGISYPAQCYFNS